jgi:hypothetical protein
MTLEINGIPCVTAAVAAEELATTQLKILMLIKQKALCGEMIDGEWYVTRESLFSYDPEEQKTAAGQHECRSGCGGCH